MVLKTFTYYNNGRKTKISVKPLTTIPQKFRGLMFKKRSPPLLFIFKKEKKLSIHSFFCKPFKAIWLNEKKQVTKQKIIKTPRINISGYGKYLLEIPISSSEKNKTK